jgi:hypothetical protein
MISEDGYNKGRDWFVERAAAGTHWKGIWWMADIEWKEGLLRPGHEGACALAVWPCAGSCPTDAGVNHDIAQDGRVAILTVRRR